MSFFDHIYPRFCIGCGKFGTYCCGHCLEQIPTLQYFKCPECQKPAIDGITHPKCHTKYGLDGLVSLYPYTGLVKKAIKQIKYRFAFRILDDILNDSIMTQLGDLKRRIGKDDIYIVPIPLYPSRENFRGFNQSKRIAQHIAGRLQLDQANFLVRVKMTKPQVEMKNRSERLHNMKQVFAISSHMPQAKGLTLLLIDDVFTTGATMRSAAEMLKRAGARVVWGLTLAQ